MDLQPSHPPDGGSQLRLFRGLILLFVAVAILAITDLLADSGEGLSPAHLLTEGAIVAAGALGAALAARRLRAVHRRVHEVQAEVRQLDARLVATRAEAERWRAEAKDLLLGLGAAIDRQLARWQLTPAETQIALLLLKGLSHKEVAQVRAVGEATVRQQSRAIYQKAGVQGRHELAAFFLEGLLAPPDSAGD